MIRFALIDGFGVYGNYTHYGLVVCLVGSALLVFVYLWSKGRLDMDETAKFQMMQIDEVNPEKENANEGS